MAGAEITAYNFGQQVEALGVDLPAGFPAALPSHPELDLADAARALMRLGTARFAYWVRVGMHTERTGAG